MDISKSIFPLIEGDDCAEVTEQLLAAGADPHAVDAQGKTALDHARERGLERIQAVLSA